MITNVYIDGFNLYYGRLKGTQFKWLNLEQFCDSILPDNQIRRIHYFTAMVDARDHDPDQPVRQAAYLRALATLPRVSVYKGNFLSSAIKQPLVEVDPITSMPKRDGAGRPILQKDELGRAIGAWVLKTEEKGSDVNLAAVLLKDAFERDCECAVVISNDSDLLMPIEMAKKNFGLKIGLIPPRRKGSAELKQLADFRTDLRLHYIADAQFPPTLTDTHGTIHKPDAW